MQPKEHWEHVYSTKATDKVSWYQEHAVQSLRLIRGTGVPLTASIIDVGGGASTLVDDLLQNGYSALTVLDVSAEALAAVQKRLGSGANTVNWIETDITGAPLPNVAYDVWHDRAVFHFLTAPQDRRAYVEAILRGETRRACHRRNLCRGWADPMQWPACHALQRKGTPF